MRKIHPAPIKISSKAKRFSLIDQSLYLWTKFILKKNNLFFLKPTLKLFVLNLDMRDKYGNTILHWAATFGNQASIEVLCTTPCVQYDIQNNDPWDLQNNSGNTPLHLIVHNTHKSGLREMLRTFQGCICLKNNRGDTPLHLAAKYPNPSLLLGFLVIEGLDLDIQDNSGNTILHLMLIREQIESIQKLLQKGANPFIRNLESKSSIDLALEIGNFVILEMFKSYFPIVFKEKNTEKPKRTKKLWAKEMISLEKALFFNKSSCFQEASESLILKSKSFTL